MIPPTDCVKIITQLFKLFLIHKSFPRRKKEDVEEIVYIVLFI